MKFYKMIINSMYCLSRGE